MYHADVPVVLRILLFMTGLFIILTFLTTYPLRRQGYRPLRRSPRGPSYSYRPTGSRSFRGGARVGMMNWTMPLVTLTFDDHHASLRGFMLIPVEIDHNFCTNVRRIGLVLRTGIRFDSTDGRYDGVIFWSGNPVAVLEALEALGWPVARAASRGRTPFRQRSSLP